MTKRNPRIAATTGLLRAFSDLKTFEASLTAHVRYAADFQADCVVFPEFVTAGLGAIKKDWTKWRTETLRIVTDLAATHKMWICAGSMLHLEHGKWRNTASLIAPGGEIFHQRKMHPTPFERDTWKMTPHHAVQVIATPFGNIAIATCYDIEFPEAIRAAALAGAEIILNPSWTDDEAGFWRVRRCAAARCVENTLFVANAPLTGSVMELPGFESGIGQASVLTPCDVNFPRQGVAIESAWCVEQTVVTEVSIDAIRASRKSGAVTPLADYHPGPYEVSIVRP